MILLADLNQQSAAERTERTFSIVAVIDSALCVGAGGSSGSLADKPILHNAEGRLVIPASQVKGRLRHECEKLARGLGWPTCESPIAERMCPQRESFRRNAEQGNAEQGNAEQTPPNQLSDHQLSDYEQRFRRDAYRLRKIPGCTHHSEQQHCLVCQIFGNPGLPARLSLSDLVCTEAPADIPEVLRPGVTINRRRRTAEEKKLYFLETSPANAALKFEGKLTLGADWPLENGDRASNTNASITNALLVVAFKHICALGGSKSAGLGWLHWELPEAMDVSAVDWESLVGPYGEKNSEKEKA